MTLTCRTAGSRRRAFFCLFVLGASSCRVICGATAWPDVALQQQVLQHESTGDLTGARALLEQEAGKDSAGAAALAEFLDRHGDAGSREAYLKWAARETDPDRRKLALREAVLVDFMAGSPALSDDLVQYRAAGGTDLKRPSSAVTPAKYTSILIPGPLSSFARMAALSPDLAPEDLLPALARNVATSGYEASANESLQQTEYLRLLIRYVGQARELQGLAGSNRKLVIPTCDSQQTGDLLRVIGYRMRGSCGGDIVLETVNATRAFITVDSGFPLTELEQDLRANHPFELAYAPTSIPVLYGPQYWVAALGRTTQSDFLDAFLSDPSLCRLYLGLSHLNHATAEALRAQAAPGKLKLYANILDFYGGMFDVRNGAAVTPGSPKVWASMVGVSPNNPGAFFYKLISTDDGWLASYFDALSRLNGPTAAYLTQPERLKRFYDALRGKITSPGPARPVFRASTELMLLTTTLRIDANGQPHVPGDLDVWRNLFLHHPHGKYDGRLTRSANAWRNGDDLLDALFGLSRKTVENEPLKIYLLLNDVDRYRANPISAQLAARLVASYRAYGPQYVIFADAPNLSETSINRYLDLCTASSGIHDNLLKADTLGTSQAAIELWRILRRQDSIPASAEDESFGKLVAAFSHIKQEADVFTAGRSAIDVLLASANAGPVGTYQARIVELLDGKLRPSEGDQPLSPAEHLLRIYDAQGLISIDVLFTAVDRLNKGGADAKSLKAIDEELSRLNEARSLTGLVSGEERNSLSIGYWSERHIEQERKLNVDNLLKSNEKKDARGAFAPLLRDSMVGLLYAYYAPAGAQLLLTNPSFVRSHDFIGAGSTSFMWRNTEVAGSGWPESAGGRLTGSLISLPYAIAEAEQNFLTPRHEQALIWTDLVPQLIAGVTVNPWRNITPLQLRWVSLQMERAQTLIAAASLDPSLAPRVLDSYARFATPARVESLREHLESGDFKLAVREIPASVLVGLASDPALKNLSPDVAAAEIALLSSRNLPELAPAAIAHAFGTPKPTLTHSYRPNLLYLRVFPALMGYSSRILAETWESNNLYYAALAEEIGVPVDLLPAYVPEWNRATIENIFATHLEDWPALVRSLHATAESVKHRPSSQQTAMNISGN